MKYTVNTADLSPMNNDDRVSHMQDPSKIYYSMVGANHSKPTTSREMMQKNLRMSHSSKSY